MAAHNEGEEKRLDIVDKVRKVRDILEAEVLVDPRARQEVVALEAADVGEDTQSEDHDLEASWSAVLRNGKLGAAQSLETVLAQGDQAAAGFVQVFHRRVKWHRVAGAIGADDQIGEVQILKFGVAGFPGADGAERLQVDLERLLVVGIHMLDHKVFRHDGGWKSIPGGSIEPQMGEMLKGVWRERDSLIGAKTSAPYDS